jgi:hypothetical protein
VRTGRVRPAAPGIALARMVVPVVLCIATLGAVSSAAAAAPAPAPPALDTVVLPNLGPGYAVSSQGPLDPSEFASSSPDPSAAAGALATLAQTIATYERVWHDAGQRNEVQDLMVRFPNAAAASIFLRAAQRSLDAGEVVSAGPLPGIPGARTTTYFASTTEAGVGQAIAMRAGVYVDLLSFFAAAAANPQPITPADTRRVALAQYDAMVKAPGGAPAPVPAATGSDASIGWALLAVAVLAAAVATPLVLRRRRVVTPPTDPAATT